MLILPVPYSPIRGGGVIQDHLRSFHEKGLNQKRLTKKAVLCIRLILIWIRIRGSVL